MCRYQLNYTDPEATEEENTVYEVSHLVAARAYNSICKMIGGRWPDCILEEQAPEAHEFFMQLFGGE